MMLGLPVVATNVGGVSELVEEGVSGFLGPALDAHALARAILRAADPAVRSEMGKRARERAARLCSTEECERTHLAAYETALEHRAARSIKRGRSTVGLARARSRADLAPLTVQLGRELGRLRGSLRHRVFFP
jgi:hypothetical protein